LAGLSIEEIREKAYGKGDDRRSRYYAAYIAKLFLYTPMTANQLTVGSTLFAVFAIILVATGRYWYTVLGAVFLNMFLILDVVDGTIARVRNTTSKLGLYYELTSHGFLIPFFFVGLTFGVYNNNPSLNYILLGFSATLFAGYNAYLFMTSQNCRLIDASEISFKPIKSLRVTLTRIFLPSSLSRAANILLFAAFFQVLDIMLIVYGLLMPIEAFFRLIKGIKKFRSA
jgi:phosphatidylserine synthase